MAKTKAKQATQSGGKSTCMEDYLNFQLGATEPDKFYITELNTIYKFFKLDLAFGFLDIKFEGDENSPDSDYYKLATQYLIQDHVNKFLSNNKDNKDCITPLLEM